MAKWGGMDKVAKPRVCCWNYNQIASEKQKANKLEQINPWLNLCGRFAFTRVPARQCPDPSFQLRGRGLRGGRGVMLAAESGKPWVVPVACSSRWDRHRGETCWGGLETSSSSGNAESRDVKKLWEWERKSSRKRNRPAERRGANVLTSDIYQQHPDDPWLKRRLLCVSGFPHHKRQILGEHSWNEVDIWSCTLGLLPRMFWNGSNSKWKRINEYKMVQNPLHWRGGGRDGINSLRSQYRLSSWALSMN